MAPAAVSVVPVGAAQLSQQPDALATPVGGPAAATPGAASSCGGPPASAAPSPSWARRAVGANLQGGSRTPKALLNEFYVKAKGQLEFVLTDSGPPMPAQQVHAPARAPNSHVTVTRASVARAWCCCQCCCCWWR